jgi:Bacterial PH domain
MHVRASMGVHMIDFKNGSVFKLKENKEYADMVSDLLLHGEKIIGSFKALRDGVVFTDKRIIAVNVQGVTGRKKDFTSLPYKNIVVFSIETAGSFDLDSELEVYFSGLGKVKFEFTGKVNVTEIAKTIGEFVFTK